MIVLATTPDPTLARCARRSRNLTQREVAAAAGIDRALLSRIERGVERPTEAVRRRLADVLDVHPYALTEPPL